ncbi:MAG: carboxypeptidase regulatory-like domain-containing protein [Chitinophagales bacterium]|nr:carboxypeptidase regulatory-like domain-containing protein [Chitinophagales bacterium]
MDSKQEARLSMYDAVISYCDANNPIVSTIPAFENAVDDLRDVFEDIQEAAQAEMQLIEGYAGDKAEQRLELGNLAASIAASVFAYASATGNTVLKEQANYPPSHFTRLKDELLGPACQNVHDLANANLVALADYGITAPNLTDLQTAIDNYGSAVAAPRNAISVRSSKGVLIKDFFKNGDDILKTRMDKLALQFKESNSEFYNAYKSNRVVVDAATSSTQVSGTVTSNAGGAPVDNVSVTVTDQSYTTTTDVNGNYKIKIPVPGVYELVFTRIAYVDQTIPNVILTLGENTDLDVVLQQLPT